MGELLDDWQQESLDDSLDFIFCLSVFIETPLKQ